MIVKLNEFQSVLHRSASASDVARMVTDLGTAVSKVMIVDQYTCMLSDLRQLNPVAHAVFSCVQVVYQVGSFSIFRSIAWLIFLAAFEDAKGILWSHEKPCKQHPSARWPARQTQRSSNLRSTVPYNEGVSRDHGRSGQLHLEMA